MNPWLGIAILVAILLAMLGVLRVVRDRFAPHPELMRKMAHVGLGLSVLTFPWLFRSPWPVVVMGVLAIEEEKSAQAFVVGTDGPLWLRDCIADTADSLALGADLLFVASGVAGIAAALLYFLRTRTVETHPGYDETAPVVATDGHGLFVGVRGAL